MENIRRFLGLLGLLVQYPFFQLKHKILEWFQSLRGTKPEISNDEMPSMQDGPASRTRSTSTPPPSTPPSEYDRAGFKSESKNFALKHFGLYPEEDVSIIFLFVKKY